MPRYRINHSYRSVKDGCVYGPWSAGDDVELTEAEAAWLDTDSPGVLCPHESTVPPERQAEPTPDRQMRRARDRGRK